MDVDDIDALFSAISAGVGDEVYDLDRSGTVDDDDVTYLVETIIGTFMGDANLDHRVDAADLNVVGIHWRNAGTFWSSGDFSGDGNTDAADLNVPALNWLKGVAAAAARIPRAPLAAAAGQSAVKPVGEENGHASREPGSTQRAAESTADESAIDEPTALRQRNRLHHSQRRIHSSIQRRSTERAADRADDEKNVVDIVFAGLVSS